MRPGQLHGLAPGDIGFDSGGGIVGALIRRGTTSPWAHCFVLVRDLGDGMWQTHEAYPGGLKEKTRHASTIGHAIRVATNPGQQDHIVSRSRQLVGSRYGYGELLRIVGHYFWRQRYITAAVTLVAAAAGHMQLATVALTLLAAGVLTLAHWDRPGAVICSNHCAQAALEGQPGLADWMRFPPHLIWPGELHTTLLRYQLRAQNSCTPQGSADSGLHDTKQPHHPQA